MSRPIELEDVARYPLPGTVVPGAIAFAPDSNAVTWLHSPEKGLSRELFSVDATTGTVTALLGGGVREEDLSIEERLRRERARELATGVTSYEWASDGDTLLVPRPDGLYADTGDGLRLVVAAEGPLLDPQLSPDGRFVAYVHDDELYVVATDGTAEPRQLTTGARGSGMSHGLAEFVAQEEMDRLHGFWWSKDSTRIAFQQTDESHIPVYRIVHQGSDAVGERAQEDHRYPFAGAANARVRLFVVDVAASAAAATELDISGAEYLARVDWLTDGRIAVQLLDRAQSRLDLVALDADTGQRTILLTETSDVWINLHNLLRPLATGRFLWASERTGFCHLEVRGADGSLERTLTAGEWLVTSIAAVDDDHVWFVATMDSPLERHLYRVALDGSGDVVRLTTEAGTHDVVVDRQRARFVDTWSALDQPSVVRLCSLATGDVERVLHDERDARVDELGLAAPDHLTVVAADGTTELHALVYRPAGDGPFPTVVSVYGGPHAQRVTNSWLPTVRMRDQYLRQLGYCVVAVDNRGAAARGLAFEAAIRHRMGQVEVADQVAAVRQLAERGIADIGRGVVIHGWSYGGYMAAMCLATAGDVFTVAVAGAPVTDWDGYDTFYTERYMGLPSANADGYDQSSVLAHVKGMDGGALLLVHGLIDENVHFRHTARLINALIRDRITYDLLLFPDERHMPRREADRVYMEQRIRDFVVANLPP